MTDDWRDVNCQLFDQLRKCLFCFDNEQNALHCLEGMKQESGRQSLIDRLHRDRGRQLHELNQPRQMDKRVSFISVKFSVFSPVRLPRTGRIYYHTILTVITPL